MGDATVPSSNISFLDLKLAYIAGLGETSDLNNESNVIKLSFFNNATFTDGTLINIEEPVSIINNFSEKTFGEEGGGEEGGGE